MRLNPFTIEVNEGQVIVSMEVIDDNGLVQFKGSMLATSQETAEQEAQTFLSNLKQSGVHNVLNECIFPWEE